MIDQGFVEGLPRLCFDRAGQGPLLVFLHGVGGHRGNWRRQVEAVAPRVTAIALDARGYGDSEDSDGPRRFTDFADDVIRMADGEGAERVHLCGLSMGGRIALDCWRRYPDRVASLVLADTSAGSAETQDPAKVEAFLAARREPLLAGKTPPELAPVLVEQLLGREASDAARAELIDSLASLRTESYLKTLEAVTRFTEFPDFSTITATTTVIVGDDDRIAPPHLAQAMADAIPGARLEVLVHAGHISNVEQPEAFDAALVRHLDRAGV